MQETTSPIPAMPTVVESFAHAAAKASGGFTPAPAAFDAPRSAPGRSKPPGSLGSIAAGPSGGAPRPQRLRQGHGIVGTAAALRWVSGRPGGARRAAAGVDQSQALVRRGAGLGDDGDQERESDGGGSDRGGDAFGEGGVHGRTSTVPQRCGSGPELAPQSPTVHWPQAEES